MFRRLTCAFALLGVLTLATACIKNNPTGSPPPANSPSSAPASGTQPPGGPPGGGFGQFAAGASAGGNPAPGEQAPGDAGAAPGAMPPGAVPAQVGVGAKGRSLDPHEGLLVTPAKAFFAAKERVVFEIQIPQALSLFKATHGQAPADHNEFMQRIVAENSIQLPMLPANRRYQYDPQTEQLMVVPAGN